MLKFKNLPSKVCRYKITSYICSIIKNKEIMKTLKRTLAVILALFVTVIISHSVTTVAIELINLLNDGVLLKI